MAAYLRWRQPRTIGLRNGLVLLLLGLTAYQVLQPGSVAYTYGGGDTLQQWEQYETLSSSTTEDFTTNINQSKNPPGTSTIVMEAEHYGLLRQEFCPMGVPNTAKAITLFPLAKMLLTQEANYTITTRPTSSPKPSLPKFFFAGSFQGSGIYMNDDNPRANLYYLRIWKAGNNQIRSWFTGTFQNPSGLLAGTFLEGDQVTISRALRTLKRTGRRPEDLCIVTAVRDPISHFLSGYNEVEERLITERKEGTEKKPANSFAPYYRMPLESLSDRKARFIQFLMDLLNQHRTFVEKYQYHRIYQMSRVLVPLHAARLSLTDYLPSVSNLTYEWPQFVRQACPELPDAEVLDAPMQVWGHHESSKDKYGVYAAAKSVWDDQGVAAQVLCLLRTVDYACWEKLPGGIPELCQSVYMEKLLV